jgi:hypothetical protein
MTTSDPGRSTRIVPVHGRNIVIRQLVDTQLMLLNRSARILQRTDVDAETKGTTVDRMFMILENQVVQPEDREFLEDLMAEGKLDLRELLSFVSIFNEDSDDVDTKLKVRRARTPAKRS